MPGVAVLLNSGGMDSRLAAAMSRSTGMQLISLFIDYNPRNRDGAFPAAMRTAETYCQDHVVLPFTDLITDYPGRIAQWGSLPYLCQLLLSIGASYASNRGIDFLIHGAKSDAVEPEFVGLAQQICATTKMSAKVVPIFPVFDLTFEQVLQWGCGLKVDFASTYSCSQAFPSCGECLKCRLRLEHGITNPS